MRSFVAGLALFLTFVAGTVALAAFVTSHVLLDPTRVGEVAARSLQEPDLRVKILSRVVPGYDQLAPALRPVVDRVVDSPEGVDALGEVRVDDQGRVDLTPLRDELARRLREGGQDRLAARVATASTGEVAVPTKYVDRYQEARRLSRQVWEGAALVTIGLVLFALAVSPRRGATVRATGLVLLLAAGVVAAGYWLLPAFVQAGSADPAADVVAAVVEAGRRPVVVALLPFAVGALLLVILGAMGQGRTRAR